MEQINCPSNANNCALAGSHTADLRLLSLDEIHAVGGGAMVVDYPLPSR